MGKLTKQERLRRRENIRAWQAATASRLPSWLAGRFRSAVHRLDLWVVDYGLVREVYCNIHQVADGVWRSAQPAPRHLRSAARRGVRTVINLRADESNGAHQLEREACARLGLRLIDLKLKSRAAPTQSALADIRRVIADIDGPTLVHCKSGSDRTGLFCALYLILREGVPVTEARRQLAVRYGHLRFTKTGILDHLFDRYLADAARAPIPFAAWLDTVYDPDALTADFRAGRRGTARAADSESH